MPFARTVEIAIKRTCIFLNSRKPRKYTELVMLCCLLSIILMCIATVDTVMSNNIITVAYPLDYFTVKTEESAPARAESTGD